MHLFPQQHIFHILDPRRSHQYNSNVIWSLVEHGQNAEDIDHQRQGCSNNIPHEYLQWQWYSSSKNTLIDIYNDKVLESLFQLYNIHTTHSRYQIHSGNAHSQYIQLDIVFVDSLTS